MVVAVKPVVSTPRRLRLRHLLGLGASVLMATWLVPRGRAAWKIHDTAAAYADYGLCMAGPTGAMLLRDQPDEFWRAVRRRLVASAPEEKVFGACQAVAERLSGSLRQGALHQTRAADFAEWGRKAPAVPLSDLAHGLPDLAALAANAWPFLRNGVAVLVKPSLGAKEAIHPVGSARPGWVDGLHMYGSLFRARRVSEKGWFLVISDGQATQALRSRDKGRKWTATSPWQTALQGTHARCMAEGAERAFGLEPHRPGQAWTITYFEHDSRTGQATLGDGNSSVVSLACDEYAAVAVTQTEKGRFGLVLCLSDGPCKAMPLPPLLSEIKPEGIDVARLHGATIIAVTQGDVVRVVSSRDDGRIFTPFTVALDHLDNALSPRNAILPAQLLAIGGMLLLTQESKTRAAPGLAVFSTDLGASWRTFPDSASK